MTKNAAKMIPVRRELTRMAYFIRITIYSLALCVVPLFPSAAPGLGLFSGPESEAPLEQERSEEAALRSTAEMLFRRDLPNRSLLAPAYVARFAAGAANIKRPGHRLSNNLLAPLRC